MRFINTCHCKTSDKKSNISPGQYHLICFFFTCLSLFLLSVLNPSSKYANSQNHQVKKYYADKTSNIDISHCVVEILLFIVHIRFTKISEKNYTAITAWKVSKYGVISGPYFPVFGLNTYSVNLNIRSEYRKLQTRNNSIFGHISRSVWWCYKYALFSKNNCFQ